MKVWCFDPQSGGVKIPSHLQQVIIERVNKYASKQKWCSKFQIILRYKGQFCYLDALEEGKEPFPIGRLRYFDLERWSLAFYTYSNERYEPCLFETGEWFGTLEQAIEICSVYLN